MQRYVHDAETARSTACRRARARSSLCIVLARRRPGAARRRDEARALFERLLALRNDVGLLAEEYDVDARRLVGNFPQAFSHVGLVNTALRLDALLSKRREEAHRAVRPL